MFLILDTLKSAADVSTYSMHLSLFSCVWQGGCVGSRWESAICRNTAQAPPPTARPMCFSKTERPAKTAPPIATAACVPVWTSSARCSGDPVSDTLHRDTSKELIGSFVSSEKSFFYFPLLDSTHAPPICFSSVNKQGNKYGNCGQIANGSYIACAKGYVILTA